LGALLAVPGLKMVNVETEVKGLLVSGLRLDRRPEDIPDDSPIFGDLTRRERELVDLMARGLS
jgi:DNA-binding NarL/FixJ family response regulator